MHYFILLKLENNYISWHSHYVNIQRFHCRMMYYFLLCPQFYFCYYINNKFGWISLGKKFSLHEKIKIKTLGKSMHDWNLKQLIKKKTPIYTFIYK